MHMRRQKPAVNPSFFPFQNSPRHDGISLRSVTRSTQVIYPNTSVDDKGEPLTGEHKYVLHFDAGKLPPVIVFWNMAMYASDMLFVENDFGRYSIGGTTDGLTKSPDGSLTILIQKDKPAGTSNWLPAPAGNFNLTMRLYGPRPLSLTVPIGCPQLGVCNSRRN